MQNFLRGVLGQVQLVEASVALRQSHSVVRCLLNDCELFGSLHALQHGETFDGDLGAASDKL